MKSISILFLILFSLGACTNRQIKSNDGSKDTVETHPDGSKLETDSNRKDEFFKEDLISQSALSAGSFGDVINSYDHPLLEGIILDITREDPTEGARTAYFEEEPSEFNMVVTIQLTEVNPSPFDGDNRKIGDEEKFHILDYNQMSKSDLNAFEALMVPGQKIHFKSFYFGYGAEDIFYIKKLN